MRGTELLHKLELADPAFVEAAAAVPRRRKATGWIAAAACLCLLLGLATPALAAAVPGFCDALYTVSPAAAQYLRPIQPSCEDQGIRMEIAAVNIHADTAEIYVAMQDLTGDRLDETTDLFDSYTISTPFSTTGHCKTMGYDAETKTVYFLVTLEQWDDKDITGDKLTFRVRQLLSGKQTFEGVLDGISLTDAASNPRTQKFYLRGIGDHDLAVQYKNDPDRTPFTALEPVGTLANPVPGVTITGMGYVAGALQIQVHYADILRTDNHGSLCLQDRHTGELIGSDYSFSFWDEQKSGSYEEYVFSNVSPEDLENYVLYGEFTTAAPAIEGDWRITFPLENEAVYVREKQLQ